MAIESVLYYSSVNIDLPNGPGVNELEFTEALGREYGAKCKCIAVSRMTRPHLVGVAPSILPKPLNRLSQQFRTLIKIAGVIKQLKANIIVVRVSYLPWDIAILATFLKVPLVVKTAGLASQGLERKGGWRYLVQRLLGSVDERLYGYVLKRAIAIDACTKEIITQIANKYPGIVGKIKHIDNATNTDSFYPREKSKCKEHFGLAEFDYLVGYIGGLPSERGAAELVEIAAHLKGVPEKIGFVIVGDDPGISHVKDRARVLDVTEYVKFLGEIPYSEVPAVAAALDVGIALDATEKLSKTGNSNQKVRQYIASGVPAITIGSGQDFINKMNLGEIIDDKDTRKLADLVYHWMRNEKYDPKSAVVYAVKYLSTRSALRKRIEFWSNRLGGL
ncbi:MAG: glycosyltransferase involved in cell wall biosynthesis [Candidatus Azotimanducaceae bacterium]